jgi:uncharacterized protein YdhG (YjbR/CyaY superfamily)
MASHPATVDEYIRSRPDDVQQILLEIRRRMHAAVPGAGETISYGIPAMTLGGKHLVYFGAWKSHISVYPVPAGDAALDQRLAPYRAGKGTLRFGLDKPVPYEVIGQVAAALAAQRR